MLAQGSAYCFRCLSARTIAQAGMEDHKIGSDLIVRSGSCYACGEKVLRIIPAGPFPMVPEMSPVPTRSTYSGAEGEWSDTQERYLTSEGTQALHKIENVSELLGKIKNSVDLNSYGADGARWSAILQAKASATHFDAIVRTLIAEGMRMPVVMWSPNGDRDGTEDGWTIGNGHHRLTACLLLGMEYVPVVVSLTSDYMRCDDSSDDDGSPIVRNGEREIWSVIRDRLPLSEGNAQDECNGCAIACECCHAQGCPRNPANVPETSASEKARQERAAWQNEAQRAAGDAVYGLIGKAREAQRQARDRAATLRAEAERMMVEAAKLEAESERADDKINDLWKLYDLAANIGV